ncbi:hypothetical protein NEAUS05_2038 [Nematocida ausubeli]|nr:hypothetical protein NEAUS07_2103 [Nematocida ausubeli]KAI5150119.1 hypothetical protein NEAUS05_2038 [Nematocida ausubeli]
MGSFIIWIKKVIPIGILLMNICKTDISLDEVESILQFEISENSSQVKVNPDGPLNFLRGLIYHKMQCMYNKRFFAPQIDIEYSVQEDISEFGAYPNYKYTRSTQRDRAYKTQTTNKMDMYTEKYHNHLIELFPSPTREITIETRGNQSFIQFLRAETTEKHALHILAMLLLFSEGVNIPIRATNIILEVYELDRIKLYFSVPMKIPWMNPVTKEIEMFSQKKVRQMISFFKENSTNSEILNMMVDKCTYDEVISGKFLDSPKFLIQSYIFGFIDTEETAKEFIQIVHTMTEKYAPKTEAPSKDDSVYDRLFTPASTATETQCMALMKDTQETINMNKVFPFIDSTQIPAYTSIPWYNRETTSFSTNHLEDYSNCVECMFLSFFCCLAYDPAEEMYRTDHMGDVSDELEEFFSPENQPLDIKKTKVQRKWCALISDLYNQNVAYCMKGNELDTGLLNMLMVISEIVNASSDEKDIIISFAKSLKEQKEKLEEEIWDNIKNYTKELFTRLAKTDNVQIVFSDLENIEYPDGRHDVIGNISMVFEHNSIKNLVLLTITNMHSTIEVIPADIKGTNDQIERMNEIADSCRNRTTFLENLFSVYADNEIRKISEPEKNDEFTKEQVRKTIENNFTDMNRLMIIRKISDFSYKKELVTFSSINSLNQPLSPDHPLVRFNSNLVGSTELNNRNIQMEILPPIIFAGWDSEPSRNLNYPRIQLSEERHKTLALYLEGRHISEHILNCDISIIMSWIVYCMNNLQLHGTRFEPLLTGSINGHICKHIFKNESMKYSDIIDDLLEQAYPSKKDKMISRMHYIWLVYLCAEKNPNTKLIKTNFHAIHDFHHISVSCNRYIKEGPACELALQTLRKLKDLLCSDEESTSKFSRIIATLQNEYHSAPSHGR